MRLAWLTDTHLDCLGRNSVWRLGKKIRKSGADAALITGDIAIAEKLKSKLLTMRYMMDRDFPVFFVLGNHDRWGSSFMSVAEQVRFWGSDGNDRYLETCWYFPLAEAVALIGVDGWYCGTSGNIYQSKLVMNDWYEIEELRATMMHPVDGWRYSAAGPERKKRVLHYLASISVSRACECIDRAVKDGARHILLATHVPPFRESSRHEGAICNDESAPYYVNKLLGNALLLMAEENPSVQFTVLAGHTHTESRYKPMPNLVSYVGRAEYAKTQLSGMIHVSDEGIVVAQSAGVVSHAGEAEADDDGSDGEGPTTERPGPPEEGAEGGSEAV